MRRGLTDCGKRCLGKFVGTLGLIAWGDGPVEEIWDILSPPVLAAITPPRVVHKSGDVSGTVGWVGVMHMGKDLFSRIAMVEEDVHCTVLSVLRKTAIPWG